MNLVFTGLLCSSDLLLGSLQLLLGQVILPWGERGQKLYLLCVTHSGTITSVSSHLWAEWPPPSGDYPLIATPFVPAAAQPAAQNSAAAPLPTYREHSSHNHCIAEEPMGFYWLFSIHCSMHQYSLGFQRFLGQIHSPHPLQCLILRLLSGCQLGSEIMEHVFDSPLLKRNLWQGLKIRGESLSVNTLIMCMRTLRNAI